MDGQQQPPRDVDSLVGSVQLHDQLEIFGMRAPRLIVETELSISFCFSTPVPLLMLDFLNFNMTYLMNVAYWAV